MYTASHKYGYRVTHPSMAMKPIWLLALPIQIGPDLNFNLAKYTTSTASSAEDDLTEAEARKCGGRFGRTSGEAQGAGRGGEGANRCWEHVVVRISEREEEEEEEEDTQKVTGKGGEAMGVIQGCADGRETHVVTEGVAEDGADQVTCNTGRGRSIRRLHDLCQGEHSPLGLHGSVKRSVHVVSR